MKVKTFVFNPLGVNSYLLSDETGECLIIDAGCFDADEEGELLDYISDHNLEVKHLINTHLHFDHILGVNSLSARFGLLLQYHKADEFLLENLSEQLTLFGITEGGSNFKPKRGRLLNEGDEVRFGNQLLRVIHIPGHSPGSILFYSEPEKTLFGGDVLFRDSVGRTDLPGGSFEELMEGIETKLFTLPDETIVYTGHGPSTTIGYEKKYNPFVGTRVRL